MSWTLLDKLSRRQHHSSWTVTEHLGEGSRVRSSSSRRQSAPNPDLLLQYIDKAISSDEYGEATKQLAILHGSSSPTLGPSPPNYPVMYSTRRLSPTSPPRSSSMQKIRSHDSYFSRDVGSSNVTLGEKKKSSEEGTSSTVVVMMKNVLETRKYFREGGEEDACDAMKADDSY